MQYFEESPKSISKEKKIEVKIQNQNYTFITDNGVFSKRGVDFGTRSLLDSLDFSRLRNNILDFGCGYGPIGIVIAKKTNANVHMIDINNRSVNLAKKNALLNKVDVKIYESNIYENIQDKFDFIITNPPIRVGNEILYKILIDAKKHLNKNGELWFVINKDQGAKTVMKRLEEFYTVTLMTKNKGFYIIKALND